MVLIFKRNPIPAGLAYFAGDIVDIKNEALAKALIDDGYAVMAEPGVKTELILPDK